MREKLNSLCLYTAISWTKEASLSRRVHSTWADGEICIGARHPHNCHNVSHCRRVCMHQAEFSHQWENAVSLCLFCLGGEGIRRCHRIGQFPLSRQAITPKPSNGSARQGNYLKGGHVDQTSCVIVGLAFRGGTVNPWNLVFFLSRAFAR